MVSPENIDPGYPSHRVHGGKDKSDWVWCDRGGGGAVWRAILIQLQHSFWWGEDFLGLQEEVDLVIQWMMCLGMC